MTVIVLPGIFISNNFVWISGLSEGIRSTGRHSCSSIVNSFSALTLLLW